LLKFGKLNVEVCYNLGGEIMKKALYRKYRPISFEDMVGQEKTIKILREAIKQQKISHAYIFSGPKGSGKTSAAKIFANALNCENNLNGEKCNKCSFCLNDNEEKMDIIEIDAASNTGVEEIRDLRNNCLLLPSSGKYKVYIIDEVHMLSTGAFNALLKILEEPPAHIIFIMATTEMNKIPITVISRAQRFAFQKISLKQIYDRIKYVAVQEKIKIDDKAIELIAEAADGSLRDGLSLLDQLSGHEKITQSDVEESFGIVDIELIKKINLQIVNKDKNGFIDYWQKIKNKNINLEFLIKKIMEITEKSMLDASDNYVELKNNIEYLKFLNYLMKEVIVAKEPEIMFECLVLDYLTNSPQPQIEIVVENKSISEEQIINNALAKATKKDKEIWQQKLEKSQPLFIENNIYCLDVLEVAIASKQEVIIMVKDEAILPQIIKKQPMIAKILNDKAKPLYLLFVNKKRFVEIKKYYVKNKENIKYQKIPVEQEKIITNFKEIVEVAD